VKIKIMRIIIKTKNLELTTDLKEFIEEKIGGLARFTKILQRKDSFEKGQDSGEFLWKLTSVPLRYYKAQV
jgi:hypothetical protein